MIQLRIAKIDALISHVARNHGIKSFRKYSHKLKIKDEVQKKAREYLEELISDYAKLREIKNNKKKFLEKLMEKNPDWSVEYSKEMVKDIKNQLQNKLDLEN